jgi:hypothetical protein
VSSDPLLAKVPPSISNNTGFSFEIQTFRPKVVTNITITATCNGISKTAIFTLKP